jgi:hypothetical protein
MMSVNMGVIVVLGLHPRSLWIKPCSSVRQYYKMKVRVQSGKLRPVTPRPVLSQASCASAHCFAVLAHLRPTGCHMVTRDRVARSPSRVTARSWSQARPPGRSEYAVGILLLLVVVVIWTSSNYMTQGTFDGGYVKPFL